MSRQEFERDYEREAEGEEYHAYGAHGYGYGYGQGHEQPSASGLAHPVLEKSSGRTGGIDLIEWARWDVLGDR